MPSVMEHDLEVLSLNQTFPLQTCSFFIVFMFVRHERNIFLSGRMISNVPAPLVIIYIHIGVP